MKKINIKILKLITLFFAIIICLIGCNKEKKFLTGTQWKLIGFVDAVADTMKIAEPESENCYLISFNKNKKILGFGGCNTLIGKYDIDYNTNTINIYDIGGTLIYCPTYDEELYIESLNKVAFFSIQEEELRLFYNNRHNYLLFKIQQQ